jgi:hypothetical protein
MIRLKNIITETSLSDDDLLDIILTYTKDPDDAEAALASYRETGDFGDMAIGSNVQRDPRFRAAEEDTFFEDFQRSMRQLEAPHLNDMQRVGEMIEAHREHLKQLTSTWNRMRRD